MSLHFSPPDIAATLENCAAHVLNTAFYIEHICSLKILSSPGAGKVLFFTAVTGVSRLVCI